MIIQFDLVSLLLSISIITWNSLYVDGTQLESPKCASCDSVQDACTGLATSGIFCDNATDREKIKPKRTATKGTLAQCVPDDYEVTGDIWDWCCFWNPKMGCQQLTGHYYQLHEDWNITCMLCLHSCDCDTGANEARSGLARVLLLCYTIIGIYSKLLYIYEIY
ncbi:uncharacterized protein LOC113565836 [Drosophila persimilis]|uniref:uncharacterized protein LOC113565836 n=1 Tax=Drosophila persimilis TaxID=7234 RepID=UPI000F08C3DF|nr:uncharacterized protein LOC113565836 [Drosophila persimilis]